MTNFLRKREVGFYIFLILLISICVPWLTSFIIIPIYVPGRYEIVALPSFLLIIAWGLTKIKKSSVQHSLISGIIIITLFCLFTYYFEFKKSNGRFIIEYVKSQVDKQDVLVFTNLSSPVFRYYCEQENLSYIYFSFPEKSPGGSLTKEAIIGEPVYTNFEIGKFKRKVFPLLKKNKLWIFCSQGVKIDDILIKELNKNLQFIKKIDLPDVNLSNYPNRIYIFTPLESPISNKTPEASVVLPV